MAVFYAFINKKRASKLGIDLKELALMGPHGLMNHLQGRGLGSMEGDFYMFGSADENNELYRKLDSDPRFKKIVAMGN